MAFESRHADQLYCGHECGNQAIAEQEVNRREQSRLYTVWACGGGVQSTAIAALLVRGDLPRPDFAVMVDVGREKASTWLHVKSVLIPKLRAVGVDLKILPAVSIELYCGDYLLIPAYRKAGERGAIKFRTACSGTWKQRTTLRWLREQGVERHETWVGISADEAHRAKPEPNRWTKLSYPLIERKLTKDDCLDLVARMGWPSPPRTSCWMCPSQSDEEWRILKNDWPEDWTRAVNFERELHERMPDVYLHRSLHSLERVRLGSPQPIQPRLYMGACEQSCECRL